MAFDTVWRELRDRCETVGPDEVLVAPASERPFGIDATEEDRVAVTFVRGDDERSLWRDQFEVLYDRLESDAAGVPLSGLPAGVDPYVAVMSLLPRYVVDESEDRLRRNDGEDKAESPFRRPAWSARTSPERVRDDAALLVDALQRTDLEATSLEPETLVDLYVLLSDVQHGADRLRREVSDRVMEYIGPDARLHGRFGTVTRATRERRRVTDEATVLDALDERGIPHEWVMGIDREKLDVVLTVTDLDESAVYDVDEQVYVQKTAVEEDEKQSRLQGLKDRLDGLESAEVEELRDDIAAFEERLETVLATG